MTKAIVSEVKAGHGNVKAEAESPFRNRRNSNANSSRRPGNSATILGKPRTHAAAGSPIRESGEISDSEILDFLQREIEDNGPLLLHDGYANCGMNRGLACIPTGLLKRDLREAVKAMMPTRAGGTIA